MPRLFEIAPARTGAVRPGDHCALFCVCTARVSGQVQTLFFSEGKEKTNEKSAYCPQLMAFVMVVSLLPTSVRAAGDCELCQRICSYVCKRQL